MKLQLTALAAAISLSMGGMAFAQQPQQTVNTTDNLNDAQWGVNNTNSAVDDDAWGGSFSDARNSLDSLSGQSSQVAEGENFSDIDQNGNNNSAAARQNGGENYSSISQKSTGSIARVSQIASDNYSVINQTNNNGFVEVSQESGQRQDSIVNQHGLEGNAVTVRQYYGQSNDSFIVQGVEGGSESNNTAIVVQRGPFNKGYISQTDGDANYADVKQYGERGTSYVIQKGSDNQAFLYETGDHNESYILQNSVGGAGHYADVMQNGSSNVSTITQISDSVVGQAYVSQTGTGNQASTIQH